MKKIVSALLILLMLASCAALASCDRGGDPGGKDSENQSESESLENLTPATLKGKTPKEAYRAAMNSAGLSQNGTTTMKMTSEMKSETSEIKMSQILTTKIDGESFYLCMTVDNQSNEIWFDGETLYNKMGEAKYKETISEDVFAQRYLSNDFSEEALLDLPDDLFADKIFEKDEETGNYVVDLTISGGDLESFIESLGADPEETVLASDEITYTLTFDKNAKLVGLTFGFGVAAEAMHSTVTVEMTFHDMGTTKVTLPEDAESYPEHQPTPVN